MAPEATTFNKCAAEAVGTFLLIFTVGCNVLSGNAVWGGASIASVLMVAIYALGGISGANFNPAVSLALGFSKLMKGPGMGGKDVGIYMGVQVVAGLAASLCYSFMFADSFNLQPAKGFHGWQAALCECLYTFMLCFVVLNVAVAEKSANPKNQFYGLAIGFVIIAGAYGAGAISGGCFNPAVAIAVDASTGLKKSFWWVYIIFEFIGACGAAVFFKLVRPDEFGLERGFMAEFASEFLGTFFLVFTVVLNVLGKSPAGAYSIAAALMSMIYALGDVSGAHFNPAVTLAIFLSGRCRKLTLAAAGKFFVAQLAGGICASYLAGSMYYGEAIPLGPGAGFSWGAVAMGEVVFTFTLCYVVLCVAVSDSTKNSTMFGLAIGSCVIAGGNAIGAVSGGSLNPAVSIGLSSSGLIFGDGKVLPALMYTLFELGGAVLAAGVFMLTHGVVDSGKEIEALSAHCA